MSLLAVLCASFLPTQADVMLPVGKLIKPVGKHVAVGSYPVNMIASPDGRFAIVTTSGFREFLSVVNTATGQVVSQVPFNAQIKGQDRDGLYYGITFGQDGTLYATRGAQDLVSRYKLSSTGTLAAAGDPISNPAPKGAFQPNFAAGIAVSASGKLVVANNETTHETDYKGSVSVIDPVTAKEVMKIGCAAFPLGVAVLNERAYVGGERDGVVDVIDLEAGRVAKTIRVGASPVQLLLDRSGARLFVANSGSDTVSIIDTASNGVKDTILLRPSDLRGIPGSGPTGIALSPDEKRLYVTLSDMNAIAVVDLKKRAMIGMIPTGWLPTSVLVAGKNLLVTCAKGVRPQNPNNKPVGDKGQYIQDIIDGTVTLLPMPSDKELSVQTKTVVVCNRLRPGLDSAKHRDLPNPGIKHVIYIVKENRTYDNVLGDLRSGNGDPVNLLISTEDHSQPTRPSREVRFA